MSLIKTFRNIELFDLASEFGVWAFANKDIRVLDFSIDALVSGTASRPSWVMIVEYTSGNPETPAPYVLNIQSARDLKNLEDQFAAWQALNPSALVVGPQLVAKNLPLQSEPFTQFFIGNTDVTFIALSEIPVSTFAGDLEALVTAIGGSNRTILVDQAVTLGGDLVVPDNITLRFTREGLIDGAHTLTVNGPLVAGEWQIFDPATLTVAGAMKVEYVLPQWWGAVGDGVTDDTVAIQAALDFSGLIEGGPVVLGIGVFKVSTTLIVPRNVTLTGVNKEGTVLSALAGFVGDSIIDLGGVPSDIAANIPAFNCRVVDITLHCEGVVNWGVYSINAQEQSGLFRVRVRDFTEKGVYFYSANAPGLWVCLVSIIDCEFWGLSGSTGYCVHLRSTNNPLLTCNIVRCTMLWLSSTPTTGRTNIYAEKARIVGETLNLERSEIGIDLTSDSQLYAKYVSHNSSDASPVTINTNAFCAGVVAQGVRNTSASGVAVHDGINNIDTGKTCECYILPAYGSIDSDKEPILASPNLIVPRMTGDDNDAQARVRDREVFRWNTFADGVGAISRYQEFVAADGSTKAYVGTYDPVNGNNGYRYRVRIDPTGSGSEEVIFSLGGTVGTGINGGAWNNNPFRMGTYYLWIDASGQLRRKGSAPTSDTDGTVVG